MDNRDESWQTEIDSMSWLEAVERSHYAFMSGISPDMPPMYSALRHSSGKSDAKMKALEIYTKSPLFSALLQQLAPLSSENPGEQLPFVFNKGYSIESAMYLASLTGSGIYTADESRWRQLHSHDQSTSPAPNASWGSVVQALRAIPFQIELDDRIEHDALRIRHYDDIQSNLRRLMKCAINPTDDAQIHITADEISRDLNRIKSAMFEHLGDWEYTPHLLGHIDLSMSVDGFQRNDIRHLLVTHGDGGPIRPIPFAMFVSLEAGLEHDTGS